MLNGRIERPTVPYYMCLRGGLGTVCLCEYIKRKVEYVIRDMWLSCMSASTRARVLYYEVFMPRGEGVGSYRKAISLYSPYPRRGEQNLH